MHNKAEQKLAILSSLTLISSQDGVWHVRTLKGEPMWLTFEDNRYWDFKTNSSITITDETLAQARLLSLASAISCKKLEAG